MAKKNGARDGVAIDPVLGQMSYSGKPKGFPTSSAIADAGFYGRQVVRTDSDYGLMNKTSRTIGITFPSPAPGSFWEPFVRHNDFAEKATEEKQAERKKHKAREDDFLAGLLISARGRVKRMGYNPGGFLGGLLVAIQAHLIIQERKQVLGLFETKPGHNRLEGVRRPPPKHLRESTEDSLKKGTHGASKDAPRVQRFAGDKLTPPLRQGEQDHASRFNDAGAYLERHQNRLANLHSIGKANSPEGDRRSGAS